MAQSDYWLDLRAAIIAEADEASLHLGPAGVDGLDNEVTGGSPAYDRIAITGWTNPSVGVQVGVLADPFDVPEDSDVLELGLWNGSQFLLSVPLLVNVIDQDTITITDGVRYVAEDV